MSAPIFCRLNLESLTPDLYNAYLAGEYNSVYGDYSIGSVINDSDSYVFSKDLSNTSGLCEIIDAVTSKEQFESILEKTGEYDAFDYVEIEKLTVIMRESIKTIDIY